VADAFFGPNTECAPISSEIYDALTRSGVVAATIAAANSLRRVADPTSFARERHQLIKPAISWQGPGDRGRLGHC
jgi:hypothetical protein